MIKIDGVILKQMIISGSNNLYNNYPEVDALNVFPVPDGDTGTNMNLTMSSGAREVFNKNDSSIGSVSKDFARGTTPAAIPLRGRASVCRRGLQRSVPTRSVNAAASLPSSISRRPSVR